MKVETQEKLENALEKFGIKGEWADPDEYGFSRDYVFELNGVHYRINWYTNCSTLIIEDNIHFWFDDIRDHSTYPYPHRGWMGFSFQGAKPLFVKYGED